MKKVLLTLIGALGALSLSAQCTPDPTIQQTIVPPPGSTVNTTNGYVILPYGQTGQSYSEVMYFKIPSDTTVPIVGKVTLNYIKLDTIIGLPSGFTLSCTPSGCQFPGGSFGCAQMSGTPTVPDSVELQVAIEYNFTAPGSPPTPIKDTLGGYFFVTKGQAIGIAENKITETTPRIYPNPGQDVVHLAYYANSGGAVRLQISNVLGSVIYDRSYTSSTGENQHDLNTSNFKPGIYLYSLNVDGKSYVGRFTISR